MIDQGMVRSKTPARELLLAQLWLLSVILLATIPSSAQNFVRPGESGNIDINITNDSESAVPLQSVVVSSSTGPSFLQTVASQGPVASIPVGSTATFTFPYNISAGTTDGTYTAIFVVTPQGTPDSEAPDGSFNINVPIVVDGTPPTVSVTGTDPSGNEVAIPNGGATQSPVI
ncbi:MAG: hypothetical protein HKL90_11115, partial [Elusimicrobia bacterium]|nr:hypothetical protein [Elusimicrobiota bacterium]